MKTLKEIAPCELFSSEYVDTKAATLCEYLVVATHDGRDTPWPGTHKNVNVWWELRYDYIIGWNENPSRGWSFPVLSKKRIKKD